ncbi:hypothetical protein BDBG_17100 [Blastomyces gilchristii SLH14081]|uniref:Uncharacterized protein n=1 Tax=Blastomyces gilchristii (strain SLH14081) TaxID=559298 RepID=A0A179UNA4_BLAGS|nr:uncharacterized protein BDBG_17100 [Blastomyces gilchristii SLH14081]OAT08709.1 hypothetical protein BDBG_17100 [Blastomyces gilchristii SLH14081]
MRCFGIYLPLVICVLGLLDVYLRLVMGELLHLEAAGHSGNKQFEVK